MRLRAIVYGALEAATVVALGYLSIAVLNILVWAIERDPSSTFSGAISGATNVWVLAQGATLFSAAGVVAGLKVPAYFVSLAPFGLTVFLIWLGFRAGRRISGFQNLLLAWFSGIIIFGALALTITEAALNKVFSPLWWQGFSYPTAMFAAASFVGAMVADPRIGRLLQEGEAPIRASVRNMVVARIERMPWSIKPLVSPALRAGTAVVAMLLAAASIVIATLFAIDWVEVTKLYESLQLSFLGGVTVTAGEFGYLPNLIVYFASWFSGVGFSIGTGSSISPLGTVLGPIPAFPMLGILPTGSNSLWIAAILVPLLAAFAATLLVKSHTSALRFNYASPLTAALSLGLSIGLVAALELGFLAWLTSGSIGPGRMVDVGVNPFLLMATTFVEVASASTLAAFFSARPERADQNIINANRN